MRGLTGAQRGGLLLLLAAYALLAMLYALRVPAWQAPDEPAHYNYIRQVAEGRLIPVMSVGDWDNAYLEALKAKGFRNLNAFEQRALRAIEYEDHQPPLYYWLSAPIYALTSGNLLALRLMSAAWGAGVVLLAFALARTLAPTYPPLWFGTAALVAFTPQHLHLLASVNNDALAWLLAGALLLACVRLVRGLPMPFWGIGLLLGLAFITKTTIYAYAGVVGLGLLWWARRQAQPLRAFARGALVIGAVAGVFALLWWGRNVSVYGFPDFLGLRAHDEVVVGQLRTADYLRQVGVGSYLASFARTTLQSFWGQFGWMAVPMIGVFAPNDNLTYSVIGAAMLLASVGLLLGWRRGTRGQPNTAALDSRRVLLAAISLAIAVYLYYNTAFVQFQGRYLFIALLPFAYFIVLGHAQLLGQRLRWGVLVFPCALALLNVYLLWRVLPNAL